MKEIDEKNEDESASYDEYITILRRHNKDEQYEINVKLPLSSDEVYGLVEI